MNREKEIIKDHISNNIYWLEEEIKSLSSKLKREEGDEFEWKKGYNTAIYDLIAKKRSEQQRWRGLLDN